MCDIFLSINFLSDDSKITSIFTKHQTAPFPSFDFHLSNQNVKRETFCHFILHLGNRHHINGTHIPGTLRQTTLNKCQKKNIKEE